MNESYKIKKITYIIPILLFAGALPFLFYAIYLDLEANGFTFNTILGSIFTLSDFAACLLFIKLLTTDPFAKLRKLEQTNPAKATEIIADLEISKELCQNVYKGNKYYFFGGKSEVLWGEIGQIQELTVIEEYSKSAGICYKYIVKTSEGSIKAIVAVLGQNKEKIVEIANSIAQESGIEAVITVK